MGAKRKVGCLALSLQDKQKLSMKKVNANGASVKSTLCGKVRKYFKLEPAQLGYPTCFLTLLLLHFPNWMGWKTQNSMKAVGVLQN